MLLKKLCDRLEGIENKLDHLNHALDDLKTKQKELAISDRKQWKRLQIQHRLTLGFAAAGLVGALLLFRWTPENRLALQNLAIGVLTSAGAGIIGVNIKTPEGPGKPEDEEEPPNDAQ